MKISMLQFLLLRPVLEKQTAPIPDNTETVVTTSPQNANPAATYVGSIREFEKALRFAGWSRTEAKIDAPMRGKNVW